MTSLYEIVLYFWQIHRRVIESFEGEDDAMQQNGTPASHQIIPTVSNQKC